MRKYILFLLLWHFLPAATFCRTVEVCPQCPVSSLAKAIEVAQNGDTILVKPGTYSSINTQVNKSLTIIGLNYPVLDGQEKDEVMVITAGHVTIKGLDVRNSKRGSMKDYAGIRVFKCTDVTIEDCKLTNTFFGIYLSDSKHITVRDVHSKGANYGKSDTGNGIHLWKCDSALIEQNFMEGHRDGIYLEFAKNSFIRNNKAQNNFRYGLHFMFSDNDTYENNLFTDNGTGVAVMYSKGMHMYNNRFQNNWGDASYGLLLKDMSGGTIAGNIFQNNTIGITMEGSNHMRLLNNDFLNNGYGLKVMANCIEDTFQHNNFSGNTFDAATNGQLQENIFSYNYWDKYEGYDLNRDGVGDIPFNPVSLYSVMVEQMPYAVMLMHSFTVDLLNRAEKNMPGIVPDTFVDNLPVMKMIKR
ncbi:MAG: nitrous oxide reductase family maturation protein NosD [Chitinophagales bacterium]